jgi:hypothetical protein
VLSLTTSAQSAKTGSAREKLIGAWHLVRIDVSDADEMPASGPQLKGMLICTHDELKRIASTDDRASLHGSARHLDGRKGQSRTPRGGFRVHQGFCLDCRLSFFNSKNPAWRRQTAISSQVAGILNRR